MVQLKRKALSALLSAVMVLSFLQPILLKTDTASAEGIGEPFVMPDTTVYQFRTQPGDHIVSPVGDPNAAPKVTQTTNGLTVQTTTVNPSRTFEFTVAESGTYIVKLGGMTATNGGTAQVSVDDAVYADYSFYSINGQYPRPDLYVEQLPLTAGRHTLTLKLKAPGNGAGNGTGTTLLPSRLTLTNIAAVTNSKTRATYYTPAKVAAARQNVQQYDWATALKTSVMAKADEYVALGFEGIWNLVPTQAIPRSYNTNQLTGNFSPVSGDLKAYGNYPWKADPLNDPWKIVDPASGYKFPTNDFAAYYRSGLDAHGNFNPSLADRSLLVNTLYPEKGPTWGVDDGYGWVDPATNKRYTFVAYYAHWFAWYSSGVVNNAMSVLQNAYVYTGDEKYARAGAVLLDRIADVYPAMDTAQFDRNIYVNSHGGTGDGKAVGSIWETGLVKTFISAYDAFFQTYDDPGVIAFLTSKGAQFDLPLKASGSQIRRNIEDGILRQIMPGMYWDQIRGNNGFHQSTLAMAAVVHDTMPETKTWLDYTFQPGAFINSIPRRITGGNILFSMVNDVDRDGNGNEAGPGYNRLWLNTYAVVADVLEGYDKYPAADLYNNVKYQSMYRAIYPLVMLGKYTPSIGDSGTTGQPGVLVDLAQSVKAFEKYGDPIYAQLAYMLNGNKTDGLHSNVFTPNPEKVADDIKAVIDTHGPLDLGSVNMTGYGFAGLRDGSPANSALGTAETRRGTWLYYGRTSGHGHRDMLNLGFYGFGLDLLPDLGYPEQANATDVNRFEWVNNTISHNTVVVDKSKQLPIWDGKPKHYDDSSMVKLIDVNAPEAYGNTQLYNRTSAMVRVDEANSYVVDFFRVQGGNDHHFSFHAAEGSVTAEGLSLTAQPTGTYAGPDVEFGKRPANDSVTGSGYMGPGFHWLKNVERDANPGNKFSVDWDVVDTWRVLPQPQDIHVKLTMLGDVDDVALADGVPPQNKPGNPKSVKYMIAHRTGTNLSSTFTSIVEPYKDNPLIRQISEATVAAADNGAVDANRVRAVKVELVNGRTDYVVSSLDPNAAYIVDGQIRFQGAFGIYSEKDGLPVYTYVHDGAYIGKLGTTYQSEGVGRLQGTVESFTQDLSLDNKLTVRMNIQGVAPDSLIGTMVDVQNDGKRNAAYTIQGVREVGSGLYELDLGDKTLIRSYASTTDLNQGFIYDVSVGAAVTIPLTRQQQWLADVKIVSPKTELSKNETANLVVQALYADGTPIDLSGYEYEILSESPNIANVTDWDRLKAHNTGTTTLSVSITWNGITREGRLPITVK